jgi:Ca-activated chloride channel family protein
MSDFRASGENTPTPSRRLRLGYTAIPAEQQPPVAARTSPTDISLTDTGNDPAERDSTDRDSAAPPWVVDGVVILQRHQRIEDPAGSGSREPEEDALGLLSIELSWFRSRRGEWLAGQRTELVAATTPIDGGAVAARWSVAGSLEDGLLVVVVHDASGSLVGYGAFDVPLATRSRLDPARRSDALLALEVLPTVRIERQDLESMVFGRRDVSVRSQGEVSEVRYVLDGELVATDTERPFSALIDFESVPLRRRLRVVGIDARGDQVAFDEHVVNVGLQELSVELYVQEQPSQVHARVAIHHPMDRRVELVEVFHASASTGGEVLAASFVAAPYEVVVRRSGQSGEYLRSVVTLDDGRVREDVRLLDAAISERVEVDAVELFATVTDRRGNFLEGLGADELLVRENGALQRIDQLSVSTDSALSLLFLVDLSGSMSRQLELLRATLADSLDRLLRAGDRASVLAFRDQVEILVPFTDDIERVRSANSYQDPEGGTALHDALLAGLRYLDGLEGKKALVLFSDGLDGGSSMGPKAVLASAQSAGISIYSLGIGARRTAPSSGFGVPLQVAHGRNQAIRELEVFARETGGLSFGLSDHDGVAPALVAIEKDLRSQYRIVYHSSSEGRALRIIDVELTNGSRGKVRTRRGYYP